MKREREEASESEGGLAKILSLPIETMTVLVAYLDAKSMVSLCKAFLLDLGKVEVYRYTNVVTCIRDRWTFLRKYSPNGDGVIGQTYMYGIFMDTEWCDCCQDDVTTERFSSPDRKNHCNFCDQCLEETTFFSDDPSSYASINRKHWRSGWHWVNFRQVQFMLPSEGRYAIVDSIILNNLCQRFITNDRGGEVVYLMKDVMKHM